MGPMSNRGARKVYRQNSAMRSVDLTEDPSGWAKFGYAKVKLISLRSLRPSAISALSKLFDTEVAEGRRGPQRIQFAWGFAG